MAQVDEVSGGVSEKSQFSKQMNDFSKDLLCRFNSIDHLHVKFEEQSNDVNVEEEEEEEEELELTLGLSLNGRFGVDPKANKKIKRASSIPEFMNMMPVACNQLMRTHSLPTETEDEWRKRKKLQSLRRMEARRKRYEKQKNLKSMRERNQEIVVVEGISQSEYKPDQGTKSWNARSPIGANSLLDSEQKLALPSGTRIAETMRNQCDKVISCANKTKDIGRNMLEDMPCVSTQGEGPNGKRIEGFLYKYRKGEEVRILCVCHGNFLTPAEFVKHAGGGDVAHPLKHIVVNPSLF